MLHLGRLGIHCTLALLSTTCTITALAQTAGSSVKLPAATIGTGYAVQVSTDGMELALPFTIAIKNSDLPNGLTFDSTSNTVKGIPAPPAKTYTFNILVTDGNKKTTTLSASLVLNAAAAAGAPAGQDIELPDAFVFPGSAYSTQLALPAGSATAAVAAAPAYG